MHHGIKGQEAVGDNLHTPSSSQIQFPSVKTPHLPSSQLLKIKVRKIWKCRGLSERHHGSLKSRHADTQEELDPFYFLKTNRDTFD
jgi:hypothetical protein